MIRPDPIGMVDLATGILLLGTTSALPESLALIHAGFLILKGAGTLIKPIPLQALGLPFFVLAGAADILSASLLIVGQPPLIGDYKMILALILSLKGVFTLISFM